MVLTGHLVVPYHRKASGRYAQTTVVVLLSGNSSDLVPATSVILGGYSGLSWALTHVVYSIILQESFWSG